MGGVAAFLYYPQGECGRRSDVSEGQLDVSRANDGNGECLRQPPIPGLHAPRDRPRPVSPSPALRMQREGKFPERRRIGPNAVRWLAEDVEEWIRSRERRL